MTSGEEMVKSRQKVEKLLNQNSSSSSFTNVAWQEKQNYKQY